MRLVGRRPATQNPRMCQGCFAFISRHHGGAEIECSMLFADIRGSTTIAETLAPGDFHELLDRFYTAGCSAVFRHEGTLDKFVGDELVAIFLPLLCGDDHAAKAIGAARDLMAEIGYGSRTQPEVGVGAAVHTGIAWYGTIGKGAHVDVTAVGDAMNVTARLASAAGAGEVLVTDVAATRAGLPAGLERRALALKGRVAPMDVVVIDAARALLEGR